MARASSTLWSSERRPPSFTKVRDFRRRTVWPGTPTPLSSVTRPRTGTRVSSGAAAATAPRRTSSPIDAAATALGAGARPIPDASGSTAVPSAVVGELHVEVQGAVAQGLDRPLQFVLVPALDPDLVRLDGRLDLEPAPLEDLDDLLRLILRDPLLQGDLLPEAAAGGLLRRLEVQPLGRHAACGELLHEDLGHRGELVLVVRSQMDDLLIAADVGDAPLEVVTLPDLLEGLVDGVVHLLQVDLRNDVKGTLGRHRYVLRGAERRVILAP